MVALKAFEQFGQLTSLPTSSLGTAHWFWQWGQVYGVKSGGACASIFSRWARSPSHEVFSFGFAPLEGSRNFCWQCGHGTTLPPYSETEYEMCPPHFLHDAFIVLLILQLFLVHGGHSLIQTQSERHFKLLQLQIVSFVIACS